MRRTLFLSAALALVAPPLAAQQTVRWNDRPTANWSDEAPRVRVYIEGAHSLPVGGAARVRFEVSDNAYVTVVRVDDDGRMTILFPQSRNQRASVRGGQVHYVRNARLGEASFIANDPFGGYVFALASYAPLDFSAFEGRDYERIGGYSRFTVVNRSQARRPDVFIDRFAAAVLWDPATPYDFDVDYYHPFAYTAGMNAFAMCGSGVFGSYYGNFIGRRTLLAQLSSWERSSYPYFSMCSNWYNRLQCYSWLAFSRFGACNTLGMLVATGPRAPVGGGNIPGDSELVPNEGVVRGGLFAPTPVPVPLEGPDAPPVERLAGRFDQVGSSGGEFDDLLSIPARVTKKMKDDDALRERTGGSALPARTGFDRADAPDKTDKTRTADASTRAQPPAREPTKAKSVGEPRRETASKGGFGGNRGRSEPRPATRDRVTRPSEPTPVQTAPKPASIQETTTDKKKPPTD